MKLSDCAILAAVLTFLLLAATGCQSAHVDSAGINSANGDVKGAGAFSTAAVKAITAAVPHADASGKADLSLALEDLKDVQNELVDTAAALAVAQKNNDDAAQAVKDAKAETAKVKTDLAADRASFWSYRQLNIWHWALIIVFASSAAIAALYLFAGATVAGPLKVIATIIGRIWSLFVPLFGNLLTMLHMKQVATAQTAKAAQVAGSISPLFLGVTDGIAAK